MWVWTFIVAPRCSNCAALYGRYTLMFMEPSTNLHCPLEKHKYINIYIHIYIYKHIHIYIFTCIYTYMCVNLAVAKFTNIATELELKSTTILIAYFIEAHFVVIQIYDSALEKSCAPSYFFHFIFGMCCSFFCFCCSLAPFRLDNNSWGMT